jgi:hypothetical protein
MAVLVGRGNAPHFFPFAVLSFDSAPPWDLATSILVFARVRTQRELDLIHGYAKASTRHSLVHSLAALAALVFHITHFRAFIRYRFGCKYSRDLGWYSQHDCGLRLFSAPLRTRLQSARQRLPREEQFGVDGDWRYCPVG